MQLSCWLSAVPPTLPVSACFTLTPWSNLPVPALCSEWEFLLHDICNRTQFTGIWIHEKNPAILYNINNWEDYCFHSWWCSEFDGILQAVDQFSQKCCREAITERAQWTFEQYHMFQEIGFTSWTQCQPLFTTGHKGIRSAGTFFIYLFIFTHTKKNYPPVSKVCVYATNLCFHRILSCSIFFSAS